MIVDGDYTYIILFSMLANILKLLSNFREQRERAPAYLEHAPLDRFTEIHSEPHLRIAFLIIAVVATNALACQNQLHHYQW